MTKYKTVVNIHNWTLFDIGDVFWVGFFPPGLAHTGCLLAFDGRYYIQARCQAFLNCRLSPLVQDLSRKLCPGTGRVCTDGGGKDINGAAAHQVIAAGNGASVDGPRAANCVTPGGVKPLRLQLDDAVWIRPTSLQELGEALREDRSARVRMVFGNTAAGKTSSSAIPDPPHPAPAATHLHHHHRISDCLPLLKIASLSNECAHFC